MSEVRQQNGGRTGRTALTLLAMLALAACLEDGSSTRAPTPTFAASASASSGSGVTNQSPSISGTPAAAAQSGMSYAFKPTATDADGDTLTFAISNKPAWATFNTTTGSITGTPGAADVGTYANITITVSDGKTSRSLATFSIVVNQISMGSVSLSWLPPTDNIDGTPLSNLAGYRIFYSTSADSLGGQQITLANPGLTRYVVENLPPATWYFSVKAYTAAGVESDFSGVASKTII